MCVLVCLICVFVHLRERIHQNEHSSNSTTTQNPREEDMSYAKSSLNTPVMGDDPETHRILGCSGTTSEMSLCLISVRCIPNNQCIALKIFLSWLNLNFGIDSCLYDGLNTYQNTWLQFLFPAYIWILIGLVICISRWSSWVTLKGNCKGLSLCSSVPSRPAWHGFGQR